MTRRGGGSWFTRKHQVGHLTGSLRRGQAAGSLLPRNSRRQLEMTKQIIERGELRLVEMNQRIADNLTKIITSLENPTNPTDSDADDAS